jgi:hypothetical protein
MSNKESLTPISTVMFLPPLTTWFAAADPV